MMKFVIKNYMVDDHHGIRRNDLKYVNKFSPRDEMI